MDLEVQENRIKFITVNELMDILHIGNTLAYKILYEQGAPMKTISKLLGHKNISTTMNIYVDVNYNSMVDTINLLEPDN